jgi:hypothetical protein
MTRRSSPPPTTRTPVLTCWRIGVSGYAPGSRRHHLNMRACRWLPRTSPGVHPAPAYNGRKRPPHRCGSGQPGAGATACLSGRDAQDRLHLLASPCRANASRPSAVKHVLSLPGDSRLRRCRRFLPPVTGDPKQRHPVNRIVGAFGSIGALPRILRIQFSQRHRRSSLSRAQTRAFCTLSLGGRCDVRHTKPGLLRRLSGTPVARGATLLGGRPGPAWVRGTFLFFAFAARASTSPFALQG